MKIRQNETRFIWTNKDIDKLVKEANKDKELIKTIKHLAKR